MPPAQRPNGKDILSLMRRQLAALAPGDRLPSVRHLMQQHGVSQSLIAQALTVLKQEGLVDSQVGRGTFVVGQGGGRRVLWVCGLDVFQGEISPFYMHCLRIGKGLLNSAGLEVDPAWLASTRPEASQPYCTDDLANRYAGLIFIGCRPDHALLHYVAWKQVPYVRIQSGASSLHEVAYSHVKRAGEILAHIKAKGLDRLSILVDEHSQKAFDELAPIAGIRIDSLSYAVQQPWLAEFQWAGYQAINRYLAANPLPAALYVQDDIIAQGAIRALQVHAAAAQLERMHVIVSTTAQTLVPYGMPVSYHVFDIRELMESAVRHLQIQLDRRELVPFAPPSYRFLERPTVEQLIAYTRDQSP